MNKHSPQLGTVYRGIVLIKTRETFFFKAERKNIIRKIKTIVHLNPIYDNTDEQKIVVTFRNSSSTIMLSDSSK